MVEGKKHSILIYLVVEILSYCFFSVSPPSLTPLLLSKASKLTDRHADGDADIIIIIRLRCCG